jgi:hypothetical protein
MIIYYVVGFFVISLGITIWSLCTAEVMPDDYDLRREDIWPLDQKPTMLSDDDHKILKESLDNPQEPNTKLKEAVKKYKDGKK